MIWYDVLQGSGAIASIVGLIVVVLTYLRVSSLRKAVSLQAIRTTVHGLFGEIRIPLNKEKITRTQERDVIELLKYVDSFFVSKLPFRQRNAKVLVKKLKKELAGDRNAKCIQRDLNLLKDQLFHIDGGK